MKSRFGVVVLVAALLAGCAPTGAPDSSPTPTGASSASTSPTPAATPTEDPAPDLSDPANWIIGFDSVGPLAIGQPIDAARAAASGYTEGEAFEGCSVAFLDRAATPSLALPYWAEGGLAAILVRNQEQASGFASVDLYGASPKTSEGIGVGSTRDALLAAYPTLTVLRDDGYFQVFSLAGPAGGFIVITVHEGIVDSLMVNTTGDFGFELC